MSSHLSSRGAPAGPRPGAAPDALARRRAGVARVLGWGLHLPGERRDLPAPLAGLGLAAPAPAPQDVVGRRGLAAKEPATRLALAAVHVALGLPAGRRPENGRDPRTAVVAAGALGNLGFVVETARAAGRHGVRAVSPLRAPNASSNVLASSVALRVGAGGPNLLVSAGPRSGGDAVAAALRLLRAGRAERVLLVAAEPDDGVAAAAHARVCTTPLRAGAACVVLAGAHPGPVPGGVEPPVPPPPAHDPGPAELLLGPAGLDPAASWGHCHGAQDVVAVAVALAAVGAGRVASVEVTGAGGRVATVSAGPGTGSTGPVLAA